MQVTLRALLGGWVLLAAAGALRADSPTAGSEALKLIPKQADLVVQVSNPKALIDGLLNDGWIQQIQQLQGVQEAYDTTNARRFYQLVSYFEKQLGVAWPEAVDRIAGGGAVFALKIGTNPAPVLLVVQGKDEKLVKKFAETALNVVEQELARQEAKITIEKKKVGDVEVVKINNVRAAVVGASILISNNDQALKLALELREKGDKGENITTVESFQKSRSLLPENPLASLWFNLETVHNLPNAGQVFDLPNNQPQLTVLFGSLIDVVKRAPYVAAGAYGTKNGFEFTLRMPAGTKGMAKVHESHVPFDDTTGSLPLLNPKGTLYSSSYYLDVAKFWEHRKEFLNEQQLKAFEQFNDRSGRFLLGNKFNTLIEKVGPHQRIVVANQPKAGYTKQPKNRIPAFAFVAELRDPEFGKTLEALIRAGALLAGTQARLKLTEDKVGDIKLLGYRFDEDAELRQDTQDLRFNFSPCFATVGNQFIAASTIEICRELVEQVSKEKPGKGNAAVTRDQVYAAGVAEALKLIEPELIDQAILNQSLPIDEARKEVNKLINLVRQLGVLRFETVYGKDDFHYDIKLIRTK
ncbi:MAG: hypothetical protein AB7K24_23365 [Gemmataceae bacterium]